jgi:hypothetical protein
MDELITALMAKIAGTDLYNAVGGRIYLDESPTGTAFPYIVFFIVSSVPNPTFTEKYEDSMIQFSIFSISSDVTEIAAINKYMQRLLDDCVLSIASTNSIYMKRSSLGTSSFSMTTTEGTASGKQWDVDYTIFYREPA